MTLFKRFLDDSFTDTKRRLWKEEQQNLKQAEQWVQVKATTTDEFFVIKRLCTSSIGPVNLVKNRSTGHLYAMKAVPREGGVEQLVALKRLNTERAVLNEVNSEWVQHMVNSFQEAHFNIVLMEYIPGGSLEELLEMEGTLYEYQCKFYGAEMLMAINVVHRHGYIHRNIQPSSFHIDMHGHLKLVDFTFCFRFLPEEICSKLATQPSIKGGNPHISKERRERVQIYQRKVTDNHTGDMSYMAPEVVRPRPKGILAQIRPALPGTQYTFAADLWSFGVCIYQMMFGQLPFQGKNIEETKKKIINWRQHIAFPLIQPISDEAKDLLKRLLRDEPSRLGLYGCESVMHHIFFEMTDWSHLRSWPVSVPYKMTQDDMDSMGCSNCFPPAMMKLVEASLKATKTKAAPGLDRDWTAHNKFSKPRPPSATRRPGNSHRQQASTSAPVQMDNVGGNDRHLAVPGTSSQSDDPAAQSRISSATASNSSFSLTSVSRRFIPSHPHASEPEPGGSVASKDNRSLQQSEGFESLMNVSAHWSTNSFAIDPNTNVNTWLNSISPDHQEELLQKSQKSQESLQKEALLQMSSKELKRLSKEKAKIEEEKMEDAKKNKTCVVM